MSNSLNSLLQRVAKSDAALAAELRSEMDHLAKRREFGLNFEKHRPETVELHGRLVRVGAKVRFLAPRGSTKPVRRDTWLVEAVEGKASDTVATLAIEDGEETAKRAVADLVVVADFRDPIYPGLTSTDAIRLGGDKPFHAVINSENYHALEAMLFTWHHHVDVIYIDPPYNTRDKDWKYNNDYVDNADDYKHSKWLSFMERRLKLAKKLLNPADSVLIVTIDEKEYLRLGLLLEQTFPSARIQMVSSVINPAGQARPGAFSRSDEYLFFVKLGAAAPARMPLDREWVSTKGRTFTGKIRWDLLRRSGTSPARSDSPGGFYPIYVDPDGPAFKAVGEPLPQGTSAAPVLDGAGAVLPIRKDGSEGRWQVGPDTLRSYIAQGRVKIGGSQKKGYVIYYLKPGEYAKVTSGEYAVGGQAPDGSLITDRLDDPEAVTVPTTQWRIASHDATQYGSRMLTDLIPGRKFPYPKSLYAVEDALRFFVVEKPDALIVDFFGGSGTTAHAVARLNKQDDGRRRSVVVTNNEVSSTEERALRKAGHRPGDPEWEVLGICSDITKPRIKAAFTGLTSSGAPVAGEYKGADEFPMADGFEENVEFFDLTYQDPQLVELDLAFSAIAPLLWLRAGASGSRIDEASDTFAITDTYGVLFSVDAAKGFLSSCVKADGLRTAFIVTDDEKQFQMIANALPAGVEPVRLYESYLRTFEINTGKE